MYANFCSSGRGICVNRCQWSKLILLAFWVHLFVGGLWAPAQDGGKVPEGSRFGLVPQGPEQKGPEQKVKVEQTKLANAVFGGGCFWCIEAVFERVWGVHSVVSGYSGGQVANPSYEQVCTDQTGHAEVVRVEYDPSIVSYEELLRIFFKSHDPTSLNAQGPDFGTRYRSVVFYGSDEEKETVATLLEEFKKKRTFRGKLVTEVSPLRVFYPAEEYHQDYFAKHPEKPYCQANILPKIGKFERGFRENSRVQKLKEQKLQREKAEREEKAKERGKVPGKESEPGKEAESEPESEPGKGKREVDKKSEESDAQRQGAQGGRLGVRGGRYVSVGLESEQEGGGWVIENVAGTGKAGFLGDGGPAGSAELNNPFGVVRGPDGCIWFCEYSGQRIRRIRRDGVIETVAGTGEAGYSGDGGPAKLATFHQPHEIRFDRQGDLYVVDMQNHVVRKIEIATGVIRTVAGTGKAGYSGDGGPATQAMLRQPHSIQFGPDGRLYICDIGNHVVRRVDVESGTIKTFAGTGKPGRTLDGAEVVGTPLNGPRSIDFDAKGDLWLATREGNQVFRIAMDRGVYVHVAGSGESGFSGNGGPAKLAKLKGPKGIAIDAKGNVWLADTESHSVRRIDGVTGIIDVVAGTGEEGDGPVDDSVLGDPRVCRLARLHGIFVDTDGSVWIGDSQAHRIRVLRPVR